MMMTRNITLTLVTLVFLLAACEGIAVSQTSDPGCTNGDCYTDPGCTNGDCFPCGGNACDSSRCCCTGKNTLGSGQICMRDKDCTDKESCVEGHCEAIRLCCCLLNSAEMTCRRSKVGVKDSSGDFHETLDQAVLGGTMSKSCVKANEICNPVTEQQCRNNPPTQKSGKEECEEVLKACAKLAKCDYRFCAPDWFFSVKAPEPPGETCEWWDQIHRGPTQQIGLKLFCK